MVKVKDTASFIERARSFHGDRFDYDGSVYITSKTPITFRCRRCSRKITCRPCDHLRNNKAITCRCHQTKLKDAAIRKRERCAKRKNELDQLRARPCKICGKPLNSTTRRKVVCSKQCGYISQSKPRAIVKCAVCGREVAKIPSKVREFNCCSDSCQVRWAAKCGAADCDWKSKSLKAKARFKRLSRKNRKAKSINYRFWLKCKIPDEINIGEWQKRCYAASSCLKERFVGDVRKSKFIKTWNLCFRMNTNRLKQKAIRNERHGWAWKVNSVASGLRRRRKKKSLQQGKKNILRHIELLNQQPKQLSFWA